MKSYPFILSILLSCAAHALPSDQDLPMNLVSDQVNFNNKTGVTIFIGNVKMDQGTSHLKAQKVTVYKDPEGEINKIIAIGNLAQYSTLPKEGDEILNASGQTIEYYPKEKRAIILGNGSLSQGKNTFNAPHIVYDIANETLISIPTDSKQKTTLVLQPQHLSGTKKN